MADSIVIKLQFEQDKKTDPTKNLPKQAAKAGQKAGQNFKTNFRQATKGLASGLRNEFLRTTAAIFGVQKALSALSSSFQDLRNFQRGVAEVNTILPKNQKLTKDATSQLLRFSAAYGTESQKQVQAFYNIVSAGIKGTAKQLEVLKVANRAALAGVTDIDTAAKAIVSSMNAYAKSGLTASQASDVLFSAIRDGQIVFEEFTQFLGNVSSIAANAGVSYAELGGAIGFITKSGLQADKATIGLRQVLVSVIKPTKEAREEARRLGIEFNKNAIVSKNFAGFLKDIQKRTKGNEESLAKLFGNVRALAPIMNIVNGRFDDFSAILEKAKNSTGNTNDAFEEFKKNNIDLKIKQVTAEFERLGITILNKITPALDTFLTGINKITRGLTNLAGGGATSKVARLNAELSKTANEFNSLKDQLRIAEKFSFKKVLGNIFDTSGLKDDPRIKQIKKDLQDLKRRRQDLLKQRADLIAQGKNLDDKEINNNKNKNDSINAGNTALADSEKALIQNTTRFVQQKREEDLARLKQLREQGLITEMQFEEARIQVKQNADNQLLAIQQRTEENSKVSFSGIADAWKKQASTIRANNVELARSFSNVLGRGLGNTFQNIGKAMRENASEWDAFKDGLQNILADIASAAGDLYIKWGIANIASGNVGVGSAQIAAGAGLKILSGLIGTSSSSSSPSGGGAGAATGGFDSAVSDFEDPEDIERAQTVAQNTIIVEGSLVRSQELAEFLNEVNNDNNARTGQVQTDVRFA
jgi:TP901 family phage tail tape measure protein